MILLPRPHQLRTAPSVDTTCSLQLKVLDGFEFCFHKKLLLADNEVHVWQVCVKNEEFNAENFLYTLSEEELHKARCFCFQKDQNRFVITHGILRKMISLYLNVEQNQLNFSYGSHGKPTLNGMADGHSLCFNMSHSHGFAIFAFTWNRKIGVDVEKICPIPDAEEIVQNYFSCREKVEFSTVPAHKKLEAFYNCWTRKEAFLKATGDGLSRPLDSFEVTLAPGEPAQLISENGNQPASSKWSLWALSPAPDFAGALAVESSCVHYR